MVGFKKDNDSNKDNKSKEYKKYIATFVSGFIIALFLVLFILVMTVYKLKSNTPIVPTSSSSEASSSEVISSTSSSESSISSESSSSSVDPYLNEKAILTHLLEHVQDYDDTLTNIYNVSYDDDYLYVSALSNDSINLLSGELNGIEVDVLLESLISGKSSSFEFTSTIDSVLLEETPSIDITSLEVFTSKESYKDYTYSHKTNYYMDSSKEVVALNAIGKKDDNYLSLINLRYDTLTSSIDDGVGTFLKSATDSESQYYLLLAYLYTL